MEQTTVAATEYEVDEEGFADFTALERDWFFLQEMLKQQAALQAGIDRCKEALKAKMKAINATGFKVNGVKCVTYKQDATFPAAKYAEANPAVAAAYTIMVPKLDVEALRRDRPEDIRHWTGHSFKLVQMKQGS